MSSLVTRGGSVAATKARTQTTAAEIIRSISSTFFTARGAPPPRAAYADASLALKDGALARHGRRRGCPCFRASYCPLDLFEPDRSGSANTYNAFPFAGYLISGASVRGTRRGLSNPPRPVVTA